MRLLLVRHAKAVPRGTAGIPDDARPLTPEGEKSFRRAARGLARLVDRPSALLTSPLPRAKRTAQIAARAWGKVRPHEEEALASGRLEDCLALLGAHDEDATVAFVGHEPHLSILLARLLGAREPAALTFAKGGAALVELPDGPDERGELRWFLPPRVLARLSGD